MRTTSDLCWLAVPLLLATSAQAILFGAGRGAQRATSSAQAFDFDYAHHGEDWQMGQCASRERQSPIDINGFAPWKCQVSETPHLQCDKGPLYHKYEKAEGGFTLQNNGHSIAADFLEKGYGGVTFNGVRYNIQSVILHAQGEHTFYGKRLPLEMHIVHKSTDTDHVIVLAIPFVTPEDAAEVEPILLQEGVPPIMPIAATSGEPAASDPGFNADLAKFLPDNMPGRGARMEMQLQIPDDLFTPFVKGGVYFQYDGSLTVPPCAEQVTWMVRKDPLMASGSQANFIRQTIFEANHDYGNWRAVMPIMDRLIFARLAVEGEPPPYDGPAPPSHPAPYAIPLGADFVAKDAFERANQAAKAADALGELLGAPPRTPPPEAPAPAMFPLNYANTAFGPSPAPGPAPGGAPGGPSPGPAPGVALLRASQVMQTAAGHTLSSSAMNQQWRHITEEAEQDESSSFWFTKGSQLAFGK